MAPLPYFDSIETSLGVQKTWQACQEKWLQTGESKSVTQSGGRRPSADWRGGRHYRGQSQMRLQAVH